MFVLKNILPRILFLFSLIISYLIGLLLYDTTSGLDFGKYKFNILFFQGEDVELLDSSGTVYYFLISRLISLVTTGKNFENYDYFLSNTIQFVNFIFYLIGLFGIYFLFINHNYPKNSTLLAMTVLNFFPAGFYTRLTMKPEIFAFSLLPWILYFFDKNRIKENSFNKLILIVILSLSFTLKASITGIMIISLIVIFRSKLIFDSIYRSIVIFSSLLSSLFIWLNYSITNIWLFSKPKVVNADLMGKWDHIAPINFFYNVDFRNLLENPYKFIHSDSLISITLLDTLSDYFGFFWNHQESYNFIAFNRVQFTENFLIQTYLPQYISIFFTSIFYALLIFLYFKNIKQKEYLLFPIVSIFVLSLNALGFPSRNFDPITGDLFKVHYYSGFLSFTFVFLLIYLTKNKNFGKYVILLLVPLFLLSMGFPKNLSKETLDQLFIKINSSIEYNFISGFK